MATRINCTTFCPVRNEHREELSFNFFLKIRSEKLISNAYNKSKITMEAIEANIAA